MQRFLTILGCAIAFTTVPQFVALAAAAELTFSGQGTIRDSDNLDEGVLFNISYVHKSLNGLPVSTVIQQQDLNGKLLVREESEYDSAGRFKSYSMEQFQTGDRALVEAKSGEVQMLFIQDGKATRASEKLTDDTVAPGALMAYMSSYTPLFEKGQKIPVKLAVAERGMVLGFEIAGQGKNCRDSTGDLCVNLSLRLKKLVKPIFMSFQKSPEGYRPLRVETPAIVRKQKGSSLEKFTARIDYQKIR
ncbi:hypothetical protein EBR21_03840 [bacterium]|nr:hypothetical protein [bacterium]